MSPFYAVTKDRDFYGSTFDELEALETFDDFVSCDDDPDTAERMTPSFDVERRALRQESRLG